MKNQKHHKKCKQIMQIIKKISLFAYLKLQDHSKIVDLTFLIRMVSTRAHQTPKTPHSWQNNVPIPSQFSESFFIPRNQRLQPNGCGIEVVQNFDDDGAAQPPRTSAFCDFDDDGSSGD